MKLNVALLTDLLGLVWKAYVALKDGKLTEEEEAMLAEAVLKCAKDLGGVL